MSVVLLDTSLASLLHPQKSTSPVDNLKKIGEEKAVKVATARNLWVPAVNNAGTWGRWAFVEIADPWDAKNAIQSTTLSIGEGGAVADNEKER